MSARSTFEEELLVEVLALPAETRRAFVERRCGTDHDLANRLFSLLQGYQENSAFLETSAPAAVLESAGRSFAALPPEPEPGDRINRYHLLKRIGEGGFGVVYLAEQEEPVRRLVALKVIRLGLDTREFIARFEAERQALAVMDHPNIARVFDAGATDTGRPYLVMELIRGIPITAYCDEHKLSVTARLGLFLQVCNAIQHAHQKGVIHCDLKPSNILIELHSPPEAGCPKVIDFGIARATPDRRTDKTLFTRFHALIGTPAYTSPEQLELSGTDVDTRSDIYSLGVLLYELLTGHQPFAPDILGRASLEEMRRLIREVDPPRPSARVGALDPLEQWRVAQRRGLEPENLRPLLRSDLDWIVMRCLEKDRARRYETANTLATDLRRHLACEPVLARPPSRSYKIEKFVQRNRTGVIAGTAVAFALIAGLVFASLGFARARVEKHSAEAARHEAEDLVSFMIKDLRPELQRVGRLPLSAQVAERAVRYFSALAPDLHNASTERNRAIALEALAYVRASSGDNDSAASLWHDALASRRRAAAVAPHDPLLAAEFALTEFIEVSHSPPLIAAQAWGSSSPEIDERVAGLLERARKACQNHLDDREIALIFARILGAESRYLISRGIRPKDALAIGREAETFYRELLARTPEDTDLGAEFVRHMNAISVAAQQSGDLDAGIKVGQEALTLADRALGKNPGNVALRETAAFVAMQLSYRLVDATMEKSCAAEAVARERWRVLVQMDPQNFAYRHSFAEAHEMEAGVLFVNGRKTEAAAVAERFVSLLSPVAQSPDDFSRLRNYEARLGAMAGQLGHRDDARAHLDRMREWHRKYVAALAPEAARQPRVTIDYLEGVCMAVDLIADWPELEQQARAMLDALTVARRLEPERQDFKGESALAGYFIGRALLGQGMPAKAIPVLQGAVSDFEGIDAHGCPEMAIDGIVLMTKSPLARASIAIGDAQLARVLLEANLAAGEKMLAAKPALWWDWRVGLAETEFLLAGALDPTQPPEAERRQTLLERASAILEGHPAGNPLNVRETELLAKIKTLSVTARVTQP